MPPPKPKPRPRKRDLTAFPEQVGYRDIAKISRRQYQTVRTWRADLPEPVAEEPSPIPGGPASPLFDRDEVVAWLQRMLRLDLYGWPQWPRTPERNTKRRKPATKETR